MNSAPTLSIIVLGLHKPQITKTCLESILLQNYSDFEVLFLDFSRQSKTSKLTQSLIDDRRIRYFPMTSQKRISRAYNFALKRSRGKWVKFMSTSDQLVSNSLGRQLREQLAMGHQVFSYSHLIQTDEKGFPLFQITGVDFEEDPLEQLHEIFQLRVFPTFLLSREWIFEHQLFFEHQYGRKLEWMWLARALSKGVKFQKVPFDSIKSLADPKRFQLNPQQISSDFRALWKAQGYFKNESKLKNTKRFLQTAPSLILPPLK